MANWLLTGATGFLGRHVLETLVEELPRAGLAGDRVIVLGRRCPPGWPEESFIAADLLDQEMLIRAIKHVSPERVIHTAGRTPPTRDPDLYRMNFWSTIHLLRALRAAGRTAKVVLTGSAAELGPVPMADLPVAETYPCRPIGAYGRSKWLATVVGLSEPAPLEVVVARVFNPIGPGLPESQAFGQFAAQLASRGSDPLGLVVGDLKPRRDFVDVRDVARAFVALMLRGRPGLPYHVGTGSSRSVEEGLDLLIRQSGRAVRVCVDPGRGATHGPADSRAEIGRIVRHTGWHPVISFEQSLADLWQESRQRAMTMGTASDRRLPLTA